MAAIWHNDGAGWHSTASIGFPDAATGRVLDEFADAFEVYDEASLSWFALASVQMDHGVLQPRVRDAALREIDEGNDLRRWKESGNDLGTAERTRVLAELHPRLLAAG